MEELIVIRTEAEFERLIKYVEKQEYLAVDTETTGLRQDDDVIGISVCSDVNVGYYVVLSEWNAETQTLVKLKTLECIDSLLQVLLTKKLIMHNAIFDCIMINSNFNVDLMPAVHTDTMILAHLLDENRPIGLKDLGVCIFGEDAKKEQAEMKASVTANGGVLNKTTYELYKADSELLGRYGAKDTVLTLKLFYHFLPDLFEQKLDKFFYDDESMPLLRGPTYDLNKTGLRIDSEALAKLKGSLEAECLEAKAFIHAEIKRLVADEYPGTNKSNTFNIGAPRQLSWLLFRKLNNEFGLLTDSGRELCQALDMPLPYAPGAKREFMRTVEAAKGQTYHVPKKAKAQTVGNYWNYLACDKETLKKLAPKYKWVAKLLEYSKAKKLLSTYVEGIQEKQTYNIIRPGFKQAGTTSGRYSSQNPNFQNLPKDDKRVKACIVARPGKVFVGADQSQLEPRVFASVSGDESLMASFDRGEDFYSVVGIPVYDKHECSLIKSDPNSFAKKYPKLRDNTKIIALATPYGRTAGQQAQVMGISKDESQELIDTYFARFPKVEQMMLERHEAAKNDGVVYSMFGRPRRIPEAKNIRKTYGNTKHALLPYTARYLLNLAMNHCVQSPGASIMNRSAIKCWDSINRASLIDPRWKAVKIVLQVHDELILEGPEELGSSMAKLLKECMENTVTLPGVKLEAKPVIGKSLAELKAD